MTQRRQVCLAALAAFLLIAPPSAQARQIVLAWDPSPEPNVTGYILFYGPLPGTLSTLNEPIFATSVLWLYAMLRRPLPSG